MSIFVTGGAGFIGTNFLFNWFADTNEKLINIDDYNELFSGNSYVDIVGMKKKCCF